MSGPGNPVGVIDIGSNSIKLLVADKDGAITQQAEETRIGRGIAGTPPVISDAAIQAGTRAVAGLVNRARGHDCRTIGIVATSAVRDAANGGTFAANIEAATGISLRILSGDEEARYIGMGVRQDPQLANVAEFTLADLGGGSLELLHFKEGRTIRADSLQAGAVRLTEIHIKDATLPISAGELLAVTTHLSKILDDSGFAFPTSNAPLVLTGGAITHLRAVIAKRQGMAFDESPPVIPVTEMRDILDVLAGQTAAQRMEETGLPANRADIMPAALAILLEVTRRAGVREITHSLYNLRWGIAAELLGQ